MKNEPDFVISTQGQLGIFMRPLDFSVSHYVQMGRKLDLVGENGHLTLDMPGEFSRQLLKVRRFLLVQCKPFTIVSEQVIETRSTRHGIR